ncbi:MAG: hypothetical protein KDA80_23635 [Planctomycetaceae bacterium]|nr:hypothetical protein [Planctomycetaceae bacterium]
MSSSLTHAPEKTARRWEHNSSAMAKPGQASDILPAQLVRHDFIRTMTESLPQSVTVQTGARLHFGPLAYRPQRGRQFGGIGMMVHDPGTRLTISRNRRSGDGEGQVSDCLNRILEVHPEWSRPDSVCLEARIPSHRGFGSGTQMALALAEAVAIFNGVSCAPLELAHITGRGARSAIGIHGYQQGGFLIDAGFHESEQVGELAARVPFPEEWRILLLIPREPAGLHGAREVQTFQDMKPMDEARTGRLCRIALTELLPALYGHDFAAFTSAVSEFGILVGEFFERSQGGIFSTETIRTLTKDRPNLFQSGLVQSSWGPTAAIFARDLDSAEDLQQELRSGTSEEALQIVITHGLNTGRQITCEEPTDA